jgi:hypothetical protein
MYHKTRGLLWQLNSLHLSTFPNHTMMKTHCQHFLASCSPAMLSRLRHITIPGNRHHCFPLDDPLIHIEQVLTPVVLKFAGSHQNCTIDVGISWWYDRHDSSWPVQKCMMQGVIIQQDIRNTQPTHIISSRMMDSSEPTSPQTRLKFNLLNIPATFASFPRLANSMNKSSASIATKRIRP